ncbi:MAG: cytochrome P450 [Conexibacter sp.]
MSTRAIEQPIPLPTTTISAFDPPADLEELRIHRPLCRLRYPDGHIGWLITSHRLAKQVYNDPLFTMQPIHPMPVAGDQAMPQVRERLEPEGIFACNPLDLDPPDHTRLRRLLTKQFTTTRAADHRAAIERLVAERLDWMAQCEPPVDLLSAYALPVVTASHAVVFDIPREVSQAIVRATVAFDPSTDVDDAVACLHQVKACVRDVIDQKRSHPGDDVISAMILSGELSSDEIVSATVILAISGIDSTANMIAAGAFALLAHPEQLQRLHAEPALVNDAVDELLRYLSLFKTSFTRTAKSDTEIDGEPIRAGERVTVSLTAVNRDPAKFEDPDALAVERSDARGHMAFGHGIHICLGQHVARLELRVALAGLIQRFPTLRLAVPADQVPMADDDHIHHAVKEVMVTWARD